MTESEKLLIEAIKNYHKKLGREIDQSTSSSTIRKKQKKRKNLRNLTVNRFDVDRKTVNKWTKEGEE